QQLMPLADKFDWFQVVRPFDEVPALRERINEVETVVMRFGNLVAKADGTISDEEATQLRGLMSEINRHLRSVPIEGRELTAASAAPTQEIRRALDSLSATEPAMDTRRRSDLPAAPPPPPPQRGETGEARLEAALQSLDELIGLAEIKSEVR